MESMRVAVRLNNEGLGLLVSGKMEDALASFSEAMEVIAQMITQFPEVAQVESHNRAYMMDPPRMGLSLAFDEDSLFHCSDGLSFILPTAAVDRFSIHIYSAAVIFNMGLVYHKQHAYVGETSLCHALHLYNQSLKKIKLCVTRSATSCKFLAVAILNNKSHIFYLLKLYDRAVRYFDAIMHILHTEKGARIVMGTKELGAFALNGFLLKSEMHAPAA